MTDMMPKEQFNKIDEYKEYLLYATNLSEDDAYKFAWYMYTLNEPLIKIMGGDMCGDLNKYSYSRIGICIRSKFVI